MTDEHRFSRHLAFFGAEGQERIRASSVAIIGLGGLGCHVAQQLAYLGVGAFALVDDDIVSASSLNRLIGATAADVGTSKVDIARRMIEWIQSEVHVDALQA